MKRPWRAAESVQGMQWAHLGGIICSVFYPFFPNNLKSWSSPFALHFSQEKQYLKAQDMVNFISGVLNSSPSAFTLHIPFCLAKVSKVDKKLTKKIHNWTRETWFFFQILLHICFLCKKNTLKSSVGFHVYLREIIPPTHIVWKGREPSSTGGLLIPV